MATGADPLQRALFLHKTGELSRAEEIYRQILSADPQHAEALHLLGLIAHQEGHHDRAVEYISNAVRLCPTQPAYFNNLGESYRALGHPDEARAAYEQALRLNAGFVPAHYNLGLLYGTAHPREAQRHYEQAIAQAPRHMLAHNNLGNVLRVQGRLEEAIAAYRRALELHPDFPEALANLGAALKELGETDEANQHMDKAAKLFYFNISHEYKCIFIHIPKNGGTSIKQVLDLPGGGHRTWQFYASQHAFLWQNYTSFAVVRNPWDRFVSAYQHACMKESYWHHENSRTHPDYKLLHDKTFEECVEIAYRDPQKLKHDSWCDQLKYVADLGTPDKKIVVDALLRLESVDEDFARLGEQLGVPCEKLPAVNRSQRSSDYRTYYNDRTRQMIEQLYRDDIEAFGYKF